VALEGLEAFVARCDYPAVQSYKALPAAQAADTLAFPEAASKVAADGNPVFDHTRQLNQISLAAIEASALAASAGPGTVTFAQADVEAWGRLKKRGESSTYGWRISLAEDCFAGKRQAPMLAHRAEERRMAAGGAMPPSLTLRVCAAAGELVRSLFKSRDHKAKRTPTWPLLTHSELAQAAQVGWEQMLGRQAGFDLVVAKAVSHMVSQQGPPRDPNSHWLIGQNWWAVSLPAQFERADAGGTLPRRLRMLMAFFQPNDMQDVWTPAQPAGWLREWSPRGLTLWKYFELEDFQVSSWSIRPLRDSVQRCVVESALGKIPKWAAALLLAGGVEKRDMQHVMDTANYCVRAAGGAGGICDLVAETYQNNCWHPLGVLGLSVSLALAGCPLADSQAMQVVMTLAKLAGTTKESNAFHNRRATAVAALEHMSFSLHNLSPKA
jgi:hypothetical protein